MLCSPQAGPPSVPRQLRPSTTDLMPWAAPFTPMTPSATGRRHLALRHSLCPPPNPHTLGRPLDCFLYLASVSVLFIGSFGLFLGFHIEMNPHGLSLTYFTRHNTLSIHPSCPEWQARSLFVAMCMWTSMCVHVRAVRPRAARCPPMSAHVLAVIRNAAVNRGMQVSFQVSAFVFLG